jgi:thioredoxin 1
MAHLPGGEGKMIERFFAAFVIVIAGVAAYRGWLWMQQRRVARAARTGAVGQASLLVFTSPTCAPCKLQQLPIVDRLLVDWRDKIEVEVIDVTEQPEVAAQYGVWSLPTTIVLNARREVVAINQGVAHEHKLREQLAATTRLESTTAGEAANGSEWPQPRVRASAG